MSNIRSHVKIDGYSNRIQTKNDSFLSILHDKNKMIEKLQRQLHFQKLQLKYYLGKTFKNSKMVELSKSCNPSVMEENIPVTLAINRFCLKVGIKSRIIILYERMCEIDGKISNLLRIQECLLRRVVEKICETLKREDGITLQIQVRNMLASPEYLGLFNNLLNASVGLRKNLDTFRICCDRLLIIEEERNSIVEQVYNLPIEQRTNCNYLIGIQIEKVQLQNRLKDILKDQSVLRKRIEQLNEIEGELKNLQIEYKVANRNCTEHMTDMLRRVNFEALGLIAKSNQQREKYTKEIVKLKCENQKILKMVEKLKVFVEEKEINQDSMKLDVVYSAGLYQALDREINQAIQDNEMNKDSRAEKIKNECRELSQKLQNARNENNLLEHELERVKAEYTEARRRWECELEEARREKDEYKAQVEDLQAIRAAYAQLADSHASMTEDMRERTSGVMKGRDAEDLRRVREIEYENMKLTKEVAELKEETNKQKSKIRRLSEQILNLNGNSQKILEIIQLETKDVGSGDVGNENDSYLPKTNSCNLCGIRSEFQKVVIHQESQRPKESQEDVRKEVQIVKLQENTTPKDSTYSSNEGQSNTLTFSLLESSSDQNETKNSTGSRDFTTPEKSIISIGGLEFEVPNKNIETTLEFHSIQREEREDGIRDILDKNDNVEEILKIGDNSMVSVKVRYVPPSKLPRRTSKRKIVEEQPSELELREDRSEDALQATLAPIKQVIQLKPLKNLNALAKTEESKPLKVTYRNLNEYRSTTDSDPATESQSSEIDNHGKMYVREVKMKLRAMTDRREEDEPFPVAQFGTEGRVKSLGHLGL
ncbi:unconventional myosin-XVIIIa-like isoform X2 [Harmonia axyridis]|uniref:unconventional myosin-XVIIIa-like isoform X2 n=1 Tax=Harmonia axyridis TaxID=115357 RepID=UPI001E276783|nr:unconventional myosin-XVIIIa-like isoform X2 [Harmonia axyridis]